MVQIAGDEINRSVDFANDGQCPHARDNCTCDEAEAKVAIEDDLRYVDGEQRDVRRRQSPLHTFEGHHGNDVLPNDLHSNVYHPNHND